MLLGQKPFTIGDVRFIPVDYGSFLPCDDTIVSATVATSEPLAAVGTVTLASDARSFQFKLDGTALTTANVNETFTVTVQVTDSKGNIVNDTLKFVVVTP